MQQWVYKGVFGDNMGYEAKIIDSEDLDEWKAKGWREHFRQPGEGETPLDLPPDTVVELEPATLTEEQALLAKAEDLGIKVDKRWGITRLKAEIEAAG